MNDADLLQAFVQHQDADAFRQLVERYADVVFATARRQVGSHQAAEDVTQAVFMLLARKAHSIQARYLAGWLIRTTRLVALESLRRDSRRRRRETEAAVVKQMLGNTEAGDPITPLLDEALNHLGDRDRTAVTLRYLQGRKIEEVSAAMGISESAAAKRVSRAVGRMRKYFARHGADAPVVSIIAALAAQHDLKAPSGLAQQAASAGIPGATTDALASSAALSLTDAAATAMTFKSVSAIAAMVGALLVLAAGGFGVYKAAKAPSLAAATQPSKTQPLMTQPTRSGKIRVGVILSHRTASEIGGLGKPYSWEVQATSLRYLNDPKFEIIPVIETGTQDQGEMPERLEQFYPSATPIDAGNAEALKTLDVIVANATWNTTDEMCTSVEAAVSSGVGLLNIAGMAKEISTDGSDNTRAHLAGLVECEYRYNPDRVRFQILATHPLLGKMSGRRRQVLQLWPNGVAGILPKDATPLIGLVDQSDVGSNSTDYVFYPLYVSSCGRGRVVGCNIAPYGNGPAEVIRVFGPKFYINCVKWAANRPLD